MNKCLSQFYVSVRGTDSSFYKKTPTEYVVGSSGSRLPSKVTASQQKISFLITVDLFSVANKGLHSYLKQFISEGNL